MRNDPVFGFPASGGTALVRMELAVFLIFQSTHPVRGGTGTGQRQIGGVLISIHPPREGWDKSQRKDKQVFKISIHPPREGWDVFLFMLFPPVSISIHPPREGWDNCDFCSKLLIVVFQSTHPMRGGTRPRIVKSQSSGSISIHPPREGWDSKDAQNEPSPYEPLRQKRIRRSAFGKAKTLFL